MMKQTHNTFTRLVATCLPDDIFVAFEKYEPAENHTARDVIQNKSGRVLVNRMLDTFLSGKNIQIHTQKYEKPKAFIGEDEISVSFSHTNDGVAAAVSSHFNVGCDMENVGREVHPGLVSRMKHPDESDNLYKETEPIQIWTFKESALKMIGTGLRKPTHSVQLIRKNEQEFDVKLDNGREAKICSFTHQNHWISICYSTCK